METPPVEMRPVKVWDFSVRLFHWSLAVCVTALFATAYAGELRLHIAAGEVTLALVVFRWLWGFVGSSTARFSSFVRGPGHLVRYWKTHRATGVGGHNPMGGWMVVVLLLVLLVQAISGLFSTGDGMTPAPLAHLLLADTSARAFEFHETLSVVLLGLVVVHLLAIAYHRWMLGHRLVRAMWTGAQSLPSGSPPVVFASTRRAVATWIASALAVGVCLGLLS